MTDDNTMEEPLTARDRAKACYAHFRTREEALRSELLAGDTEYRRLMARAKSACEAASAATYILDRLQIAYAETQVGVAGLGDLEPEAGEAFARVRRTLGELAHAGVQAIAADAQRLVDIAEHHMGAAELAFEAALATQEEAAQ